MERRGGDGRVVARRGYQNAGSYREQGEERRALCPKEVAALDHDRCHEVGRYQYEVLDAGDRRQGRKGEKHKLPLGRRPVDRLDGRRNRSERQGVADEVGDGERDHHQHRNDECIEAAQVGVVAAQLEVARDHVDRNHRERCRKCVLRLHQAVGSLGREEAPERRSDQRLEEPWEMRNIPSDRQAAVRD